MKIHIYNLSSWMRYTVIAVTLCLTTLLSHGRIFKLTGSGPAGINDVISAINGASIYKSDIVVNGKKGYLETIGTSTSFRDTMKTLIDTYGKDFIKMAGDGMIIGNIDDPAYKTTIMAIKMPQSLSTVIYLIRMTRAGADSPARPAAISKLPSYPGSSTDLGIEDEKTGMSLSFEKAPAATESIQSYMTSSMQSSGWSLPIKPVSAAGQSCMSVFSKAGENCILYVQKSQSGYSTITLLHMPLKL